MTIKRADTAATCANPDCGQEFYPWVKPGGIKSEYCSVKCKTDHGPWARQRMWRKGQGRAS